MKELCEVVSKILKGRKDLVFETPADEGEEEKKMEGSLPLKFLVDRQESILSPKSLHPLFSPNPISPHTANDSNANRPEKNIIAIDIGLGENSSFLFKIIHKKIKNTREKTAVTAAATMGKRQRPLLYVITSPSMVM